MRIFPTVRWRFLALFAASFGAFAVALWVVQGEERRRLEGLEQELRAEARRQLERRVALADRPLEEFLADYAPLAATREFVARPQPAWAHAHFESALVDRHVELIWVLRQNAALVYRSQREPAHAAPEIPSPAQLLHARRAGGPDFSGFAESASGLWQLCSAPILEPRGEIVGWLVVGRRWSDDELAWLSRTTGTNARLLPAAMADSPMENETGDLVWRRALTDFDGRTLRVLELTQPFAGIAATAPRDWTGVMMFVAFAALLLTGLSLAVRAWVLRPLGLIGDSLATATPSLVEPLLKTRDEFSTVAETVQKSFQQREALEREIVERRRAEQALRTSEEQLRHAVELRSRLARDLHDHVIQSIYAAGLGLESVRAQMSVDPFGAEGRIRHCMNNLNETIRQVRSYINDLEPDPPAQRQRFTDAVRALTATMRELWPVVFTLDLNETLSTRLTNVSEIHALQIVRESLSNAIRHGHASRVEIAFRAEGDDNTAVLEVRDNGIGFDPVQRMGTGRGLVNLTTRAREMGATLRLDSAEGRGTTVTLRLPLVEGAS